MKATARLAVALTAGILQLPCVSPAAEIVQIGPETAPMLPLGKEVDAIHGDFLLRSDTIAAVIGGIAPYRDANVNTQSVQGAVIDLVRLDLPGGDNDLLTVYYPQGHYLDAPGPTTVEILQDRGDEVALRFTRPATGQTQGDPVDVATVYRLRDGEPFLRIETTYRNPGPEPAEAAVYDKIRADTLFRIPPAGDTASLIYDEPWHHAAYGVVRSGGSPIRSYANPAGSTYFLAGGNRLDFPDLLSQAEGAAPIGENLPLPSPIPAGGEVTIDRFLVPGRHPADVQLVLADILGEDLKPVPLRVVDTEGQPVAGATVQALANSLVSSEGRTDAEGRVSLALEPGSKPALVVSQRGRAESRSPLTVGDAAPEETTIAVGPIAEASFDVVAEDDDRDRGPVKVVLRGIDGTADPNLGPDALPGQAGNLCFSADGRFTVALPPGSYEAIIGRGPEFTLATERFKVDYGTRTTVSAEIRRVVDSPGWVIADFHNHTTASNDSIADTAGRVLGIAASGVEFAPATEHNRITTFAPFIEAQHLEPFLRSTGGIELSGRPGPGPINHQNAFPLRVQEGIQDGGAPRTDRDPKVQISRLAAYDENAEKFVQHNHPDVGWLYYDRDRDGQPDGGFGTRPFTHAIELSREILSLLDNLAATDPDARRGRAFLWLQMLNQGDRIYGSANSDAHTTSFNNGSIFTYLHSGALDDPAQLDPLKLARSARSGHMVLSNGPFLDVSIGEAIPGDDLRATGPVDLNVRVQCAPWYDVDRVQVLINGRPDPALDFSRATASDGFLDGDGSLRFERTIPLDLPGDAHVIVVAVGESSQMGPFNGPHGKEHPTALSNPIFLDVDGGGFSAIGDTLGVPLPVGSRGRQSGGDGE